jgi:protein O-GlcNAc transferase
LVDAPAASVVEIAALIEDATALLSEGPNDLALARLAAAAARHREHGVLAMRHADALHAAGRLAEAIVEYRRAVALDARLFDAWYGSGCAELARGAAGAAAACLGEAVRLSPERADAQFNLGKALFDLGEAGAAIEHLERACDADDPVLRRAALAAVACIIPGAARADNAAVLAARRRWAAPEAGRLAPAERRWRGPSGDGGRLRIGYVSSFFGARNWMKPVWGVINEHDRAAFELHLFCDGEDGKASGYRDYPQDHVHDVRGAPDDGLADYIAAAGIDILVDLNGYSVQRRLPVFMRRPAPIIAAWFGMYATTGIDAFGYTIADIAAVPTDEKRFCSERVLRLPGSYLGFCVPYPTPAVAPPPCLADGRITFGSFASHYKMSDAVVASWAEILGRAPEARLLVKNRGLGEASVRAAFLARFAARGVAPQRVLCDGPAEHDAFLAAYDRVDIALDVFPYNGATTTIEALWQGVPVLACNGDRWAGRTSRSLLLAAGLAEWCTAGRREYVERGVELARTPQTPALLAALREAMRGRLERAPVCDTARLCRRIERFYRAMARRAAGR